MAKEELLRESSTEVLFFSHQDSAPDLGYFHATHLSDELAKIGVRELLKQ